MAKVIYISPSNHGKGANKCLKTGCYEDKHTRPIAEVCAKHLKYNGFKVVIAKDGTSMATRCNESDKINADLHVPIHTNASSSSTARYLMFMFWKDDAEHRKIFNAVSKHLEAVYPSKKDAVFDVRQDLYEINTPKAKTLYCELGFHTNKTDVNEFIHNSEMVGKALAKGICDYFGVTFKDGARKDEVKTEKDTKDDSFLVRVQISDLYIRTGAGTNYKNKGFIEPGVYTIVETKGDWGKLKTPGVGWIHLGYTERV